MSGLTTLVDTMLASKLSERIDLLPLRPETKVGGPEAVTRAEKVSNDIRLPSREAMLRQIGTGLLDTHDSAAKPQVLHASANTTLSAAARAISAILGPTPGVASAVRGSAPVWSLPTAPAAPQLAAALARTVATSGLFYESHLSQFATGARPLAELAQEPQARLGSLVPSDSESLPGQATPTSTSTLTSTPAPQAGLPATPLAPAVAVSANPAAAPAPVPVPVPLPVPVPVPTTSAVPLPPNATGPVAETAADAPQHAQNASASHRPTSASIAAAYNAAGAAGPQQSGAPSQQSAEAVSDAPRQSAAPEAARAASQTAAGIHPDAVVLVRQQLELLAVPVIRWSGEVWPGTQMDWELHEERGNQQEGDEPQAAPRTWQTRLTMTLPTLGAIEVRLSLVDTQLQAHLAAGEETSIALLRNDGDDLRARFAAAGLQLTGLQVASLDPASGRGS